jgi:hypothetical protein
MAKFGMYTNFAGVKRLTLEQFRNLFVVREVNSTNSKNLLLG